MLQTHGLQMMVPSNCQILGTAKIVADFRLSQAKPCLFVNYLMAPNEHARLTSPDNCPEKMPSRTSRNDFATRSCYKSARCTKQPYQNQPRTKSRRVMRGDLQQIIDHNRSRKEYCSTTFGFPSTACAYLISKVQQPLEEPHASRLTWSDP